MVRLRFFTLYLITVIPFLFSCKKNEDSDLVYTNKEIYAIMLEYYLWYEHIPEVNPAIYPSVYELLSDIVYQPIDRWSFIMPTQEFNQYFSGGEYVGHGFSSKWDQDDNLRISYIYKDSDLYPRGVKRGWIIKKINGTEISPSTYSNTLYGASEVGVVNAIEFEDQDGDRIELSSTKKTVKINTVLHSDIIDVGDKKVGHCVYESFITPSNAELDTVFTEFLNEGVTDLILDLRYNGGGSTEVAVHLASLIAGNIAENEVLVSYIHNVKNTELDTVQLIKRKGNSINIRNLVVIATQATASASELIINGLEPYMNVVQVGGNSHGKPTGMYVFELKRMDYMFAPVCFKLANSEGYGDYYDGLPADIYAEDDLTRDFGDSTETCLAAAIEYIETGVIGPVVKKTWEEKPLYKESVTRFEMLINDQKN